jgi:hypothetical protein
MRHASWGGGGFSHASPPGVEAQHTASPSRLSELSPPRLEEGTDQERAPRRHSGGESDSHDEDGPPSARVMFTRKRTMIGHRAHRHVKNSRVDPKDREYSCDDAYNGRRQSESGTRGVGAC